MRESMVVLASSDQGALATVQQRCSVVSALPPRLLIVKADEPTLRALRTLPGVEDVIGEPIGMLPASLDETERLFAQAWQQRLQSQDKQRPGEGLSWDTPGYSPPDKPDPAPR
jgi:hypothetical protein